MEALPELQPVTRLSPLVIRILGGNPGKFTLQGTNTYLVGKGRTRILIDSGEGKAAWKESLAKTLEEENASISHLILTHWHPDHVGGVRDALALSPDAKVYKSKLHDAHVAPHDVRDGDVLETEDGSASLKAVYSPGHTVDHFAFVLQQEDDAMFTADNVLGHGTAVFEDLKAYMESLERMGGEVGERGRAYPGHGEVITEGKAKILEYISHRKQREEQIIGVLKSNADEAGQKERGWSSMGIVKVVYKGYPENLFIPAEGGVIQILNKLEREGKVSRIGEENWALGDKSSL